MFEFADDAANIHHHQDVPCPYLPGGSAASKLLFLCRMIGEDS